MGQIHPTAIVDPRVEMEEGVSIGAYCIVRAGVRLGAGTIVLEHSHLEGNTTIGRNCRIGPSAFVGLAPQHLKYDGAGTATFIGDNVVIREMASIHRSIAKGPEHATRVGNRCWLMAACHVAHDCHLGDDVVLANAALLGGHCTLGDRVFIGGAAAVHQHVRIGRLTIIAGNEAFTHDVPPFAAVRRGGMKGYNAIGCKRAGMSRDTIHAIRGAFHCLHTHRMVPDAVAAIKATVDQCPEVQEMLNFISSTKRGIIRSLRFRTQDTNDLTSDSDDTEEADD